MDVSDRYNQVAERIRLNLPGVVTRTQFFDPMTNP
jgi:hypothetical protein